MDRAKAFVEQNRLLGDRTRPADPATPVPTCPEWTLRQLLTHVGRGHRWAATIVRNRAEAYVDIRSVADGKPPADPGPAADWLAQGAQLLLDAVAATGPDIPVWTFVGPQPASWWVRRRLHETVVHGADGAIALGEPYTVEPEVAADGIAEWLSLLAARPAREPLLGPDETLHLHATDDGIGAAGEFMIRSGPGGLTWEHGHGKGTTAVRGTAADLLMGLLRRISADAPRLQVLGDAGVLASWLERTDF